MQRATRGFLLFFLIDVADVGVDVDFAESSSSVEATRRLALAKKTSQSSKRTISVFVERERERERERKSPSSCGSSRARELRAVCSKRARETEEEKKKTFLSITFFEVTSVARSLLLLWLAHSFLLSRREDNDIRDALTLLPLLAHARTRENK